MRKFLPKAKKNSIDKNLLIFTLFLLFIGLVAIADVSAPVALQRYNDQYWYAKQHLIRISIGFVVMLVLSKLEFGWLKKISLHFMVFAIILLTIVLVPGLATQAKGASRWIDLGFFVIQPTEVAKLAIVIYFAKLASLDKKFYSYAVMLHLIAFMIMLQPDLGSTIMIMFIGISQMFIAGLDIKKIFVMILFDTLAVISLTIGSDYRRDRLMTFLDQSSDPLNKGYHIRQILIALGAGGLWGVGIGQSRQKNFFLPETPTDSIFAVIAEEIGFSGSFVLILLLFVFVFMLFRIANSAPDIFSKVLGFGITAWVGGQIIMNLAAIVALVPLTGIPLPFISYGGSSIILILAAVGIMLNISRYAK